MGHLSYHETVPLSLEPFEPVLGERYVELLEAARRAEELLAGRVLLNVNSTARGGGVAELLRSLLGYGQGTGLDARWAVVEGTPEFFRITKRIHNRLHGFEGDGGPLDADERDIYEDALAAAGRELSETVGPRDIVFLHDPQTAGLIPAALESGAKVIWRCHVGIDEPNDLARGVWDFLRPYVERAHAMVFSRRRFIWEGLDPARAWIVAPSIDIFAVKNAPLEARAVDAILRQTGIIAGEAAAKAAAFTRADHSTGLVSRPAHMLEEAPLPADARIVAQVSRWDRLKDPVGVLRGFADHCPVPDAHLLLVGPSASSVADDPEGAEALEEVRRAWQSVTDDVRARIHLASLPMEDHEENAAIVNAIQRRADVVVQKSIAEGFGLTVAEAMWKSRPVIATRRGGIQEQIRHGESGLLLDDPGDLETFGALVGDLLSDPERAAAMGAAAHERVLERFLGSRHMIQLVLFLQGLLVPDGHAAR